MTIRFRSQVDSLDHLAVEMVEKDDPGHQEGSSSGDWRDSQWKLIGWIYGGKYDAFPNGTRPFPRWTGWDRVLPADNAFEIGLRDSSVVTSISDSCQREVRHRVVVNLNRTQLDLCIALADHKRASTRLFLRGHVIYLWWRDEPPGWTTKTRQTTESATGGCHCRCQCPLSQSWCDEVIPRGRRAGRRVELDSRRGCGVFEWRSESGSMCLRRRRRRQLLSVSRN